MIRYLKIELPTLADRLDVECKRGDAKILGLSNWKMKLLGNKMGQTVGRSIYGRRD